MKTSFSDATQYQNSTSGNGDFKVQFFSIKPGEQAIVRILVDSEDDLAAYGFHEVPTPDNKFKRVNCIRSLREDINKCPLCAANVKFDQQIYIHLLQYFPDGRVEAKTWGRKPPVGNKGTGVVDQIRKALATYGALSNYVSSISRTGTGLETSYSININLPEQLYPAASFPIDRSAFEDYSEEGTIIKDWTPEEMNTYLTTGAMPTVNTNNAQAAATPFNAATAQPAYQPVQQQYQQPAPQPVYQQPAQPQYQQVPESVMADAAIPFDTNETLPFGAVPTQPQAQAYGNVPQQQPAVERPIRRMN